jgi:hypothetical protein
VIYNGCFGFFPDFEEDAVLRDMVVRKGARAREHEVTCNNGQCDFCLILKQ